MNYRELVRSNLIKRQRPDYKQISKQISRAKKDLHSAEAILSTDPSWAVTIAYHSMLRAGRALLYSHGYLPTGKNSHKTIVETTRAVLGKEYYNLIARFNRLRRERHHFIYNSKNHVNAREAKAALKTADRLIKTIITRIKEKNPQRELGL